ncbi:hypothetical protein N7481_011190 [Penicillium waksmanii]|uniref:uncharacterized protein n=1 Tax=Penicillium waksmanii TaxID=69791 RepID=UPI0025483987|nr:uncharacterized protein N7481_011190 [Penicillium waksmanii]KAJ5973980.1 hypothetical protein N7481_011190 [Penicillium waksmanii]
MSSSVTPLDYPYPLDLRHLFRCGWLSGVTVESADQEFRVHSLLLSLLSEVFAESDEDNFQLKEDHPRIVEVVMRFIYQMNYDDVVEKSGFSKVKFHIKLYLIATKYCIEKLWIFVEDNLKSIIQEGVLKDGFSDAIDEYYNRGCDDDGAHRHLFVEASDLNFQGLKDRDDFLDVVQRTPDFVFDLILEFRKRLPWG